MQKEQLSALMDGETLDSELLNELAHNPEMQKTWESYHLIRDSMRGDTPEAYPNGRSRMRIACSYRWRPAL